MYEDLPPELKPVVTMTEPNERIPLYDAPIEIHQDGKAIECRGVITFRWMPSPELEVALEVGGFRDLLLGEAELVIVDRAWRGKAFINSLGETSGGFLAENFGGFMPGKQGESLSGLMFHVPNAIGLLGDWVRTPIGGRAARLVFEGGDWRVTWTWCQDTRRCGTSSRTKAATC